MIDRPIAFEGFRASGEVNRNPGKRPAVLNVHFSTSLGSVLDQSPNDTQAFGGRMLQQIQKRTLAG